MGINWLQFVTSISSMLAGGFWIKSATVTLPRINAPITEAPDLEALTKQSRWNAAAAICAAVAAIAQAFSFLGTLPQPN